jgi:RNA polymerase-binding transcription factor DksA
MTVQYAPLQPAVPMADADLQILRAELEEQRRFRVEQLDELAADVAQAQDAARQHVARVLATAAEEALRDIGSALDRMDRGGYGVCLDCKRPIQRERLEVVPMSRFCTPCQRRADATMPWTGRGR